VGDIISHEKIQSRNLYTGVSPTASRIGVGAKTLNLFLIEKFTVAGYPSELYYRGSSMWETLYGMICAYPIVIFVFVPVYYSLGITSVYQVM